MPFEVELLVILPAAFFFSVGRAAHAIAERSQVFSQALGIQLDFGDYYDQLEPLVLLSAGMFSIGMYFKARKWIHRKISASLM